MLKPLFVRRNVLTVNFSKSPYHRFGVKKTGYGMEIAQEINASGAEDQYPRTGGACRCQAAGTDRGTKKAGCQAPPQRR